MATSQLDKIPTYTLAERERRWQLARTLIDEEGLGGVVVFGDREGSSPAPFAYDTFFTNDRPGATVVFPRDGEPMCLVSFPMAVADHLQASMRGEDVWIRRENVFAGRTGAALVELLQRHGLAKGTLGVIGLEPYPPFYFEGVIPYNTWKSVIDALPDVTFKSVGRRFFQLTASRSAEEVEALRWSARAGEAMSEAMLAATSPGVSEAEIYAAIVEACPRHVGFTGEILLGSGSEFLGWGPPSWLYRPQAPRVIEEGEVVYAEICCSFGMLETQQQPTIAVGEIDGEVEEAAGVARESYERGLEALRSGNRFGEVVEAMEAPIKQAGGWHLHPIVHSMNPCGLIGGVVEELPGVPGADRYGRVGQIPLVGAEAVLAPGMTFAFEPNCVIGSHMVNLGGTVLVGDDEPVELNQIATRLMHA